MADEGKEFPDDFDPVPTPLTGAERVLVEKGTATIDDIKAFARTGLPAPSAASDAATKGYVDSKVASMPAPPDLEWWDPVWTPVSNVDSVSNVECSYTRAYRAAGGSLVTLEGTIEVEIDEDDANTVLYAPLPVPATSTGMLPAPAIGVASGQFEVRAVVTDTGSGSALVISAGELSNATGAPATLTIGFRASYRAA